MTEATKGGGTAVEQYYNAQRRIDYYKRRLTYDVKKRMAHFPEQDRNEAIERGHRCIDLGMSRLLAYYHTYNGVLL